MAILTERRSFRFGHNVLETCHKTFSISVLYRMVPSHAIRTVENGCATMLWRILKKQESLKITILWNSEFKNVRNPPPPNQKISNFRNCFHLYSGNSQKLLKFRFWCWSPTKIWKNILKVIILPALGAGVLAESQII